MASLVRASSAKFTCPLPGPRFRPLERVHKVLIEHRCVVLEAPAGFGKTSHLAQWVRDLQAREGTPHAWLSLDPGDADPVTLAQNLATAIARAWPGLTVPVNPHLRLSPAAWFAMGQHLAAVLEPLDPFVIVLDDVDRLQTGDTGATALLEAFVAGAPPGLRLLLGGQATPVGLPLARWRREGRAAVVGVEALRLDASDVRRLLGAELGQVARDLADRVTEATGGWPLVVRLVAQHLSSRGRAGWDANAIVAQGDDLYRYLTGEILSQHPPDEQQYLMALSLPDQVDPVVAETLCPGQGGEVYARLVRPPWFTALGGGGEVPARLHPLLRGFLAREAERRMGSGVLRDLRVRLAAFLAGRRQFPEAIDQLLAAEAWEAASRLLDRAVPRQLAMGRVAQVRAWVEALAPAVAADAAPLLLARARVAAIDGAHLAAFRLAEAARARYAEGGDLDGAIACLCLCASDLELAPTAEVTRAARAVCDAGPPAAAAWARLWLVQLEAAGGHSPDSAAIEAAVEAVEGALPLDPHTPRARNLGDRLHYLAGSVGTIRCTAAQMVESLSAKTFDYWPALLYAGRWDELEALLDEARAVAPPPWARDFVEAWMRLPRAVLLALRGDAPRALELAEATERALLPAAAQTPSWPLEVSVLRAVKTGCLLRVGRAEEAERLTRANQAALSGSPTMAPVGHLDLACVLLWCGRGMEAEAELDSVRMLASDPGLRGLYYRTLRLCQRLDGDRSEGASAALVEALTEVERSGAYGFWPLYDPGPIRLALARLDEARLGRPLAAAARRVRHLYGRGATQAPAVALGPELGLETLGRLALRDAGRELLLPSRRVAELLIRLVWAEGASLSRETVAEAIWPETAATDQMNRLRVTLHALRRWLGGVATAVDGADAPSVAADRASVRLVGWRSLGWDVVRMRADMGRAREAHAAGDRDAVGRHARAALDLYQGPFLPDPVWYEAFLFERQALQREHATFAEWAAAVLGLSSPELVPLLERAVHANATEESLHRLWLESLVRQGRMSAARRALRECAMLLESQVGVEPPEEWVRMVQGGR